MKSNEPPLHVVLYNPEIPPNTGNVGRLCLGVGAAMHVVHPIGFSIDEKAVRRAGLDYWKHVDLREHADGEAFWNWAADRRVYLFSTKGGQAYTKTSFQHGDVLVFGCETKGLPAELVHKHGALRIPIRPQVRSLNLSNAVAIVTYAAIASIDPPDFT